MRETRWGALPKWNPGSFWCFQKISVHMVWGSEFQSCSTLISVHPPQMRFVPWTQFFSDLPLDSYQKFWWPQTKYWFHVRQYQHCKYPYMCTPTDEDSVHLYSWTKPFCDLPLDNYQMTFGPTTWFIYTPGQGINTKYPYLYILHGWGQCSFICPWTVTVVHWITVHPYGWQNLMFCLCLKGADVIIQWRVICKCSAVLATYQIYGLECTAATVLLYD